MIECSSTKETVHFQIYRLGKQFDPDKILTASNEMCTPANHGETNAFFVLLAAHQFYHYSYRSLTWHLSPPKPGLHAQTTTGGSTLLSTEHPFGNVPTASQEVEVQTLDDSSQFRPANQSHHLSNLFHVNFGSNILAMGSQRSSEKKHPKLPNSHAESRGKGHHKSRIQNTFSRFLTCCHEIIFPQQERVQNSVFPFVFFCPGGVPHHANL